MSMREDAAVLVDGQARLDAVIAGVDVAGEALQPVGDELHRPAQQLRHDDDGDLVGVDVDLDAVAAADVACR